MGISTFQASTCLSLGPGALAEAGAILKRLGIASPLVVTDPGLVKAGITQRVVNALTEAGLTPVVFDEVEPNPSFETVNRAIALFREAGCAGLVAAGGGSPIDVAKAVGILASNPGDLSAYVGVGKVVNPLPTLLAVPTTVGTGSEVTQYVVITDRAKRKKVVVGSPLIVPHFALLDPELVLSLPANLVAYTGMDALAHAVESIISVFASPFADALALEAIQLITANLPVAVKSGAMEPRAKLLYASTMAGLAFSYARTGLVHGMAHPLSSYYVSGVITSLTWLCH